MMILQQIAPPAVTERLPTSSANMHTRNNQQQRGVTIIELLLVLAIIAAILFLGIYRYQTQKRLNDLAQIRQNVSYIFHAMNQYYRLNCKTNETPAFTITMANLEEYLPPLAKNELIREWGHTGYDYDVSVHLVGKTKDSEQDIYQLTVKAMLNIPADTIDWYAAKLDAAPSTGSTLTWTSMPSYRQPTLDSGLWIMEAGAGYANKLLVNNSKLPLPCGY